jgi:hypothetical protein
MLEITQVDLINLGLPFNNFRNRISHYEESISFQEQRVIVLK